MTTKPAPDQWLAYGQEPGTQATYPLSITQNYSGSDVWIPITVWKGKKPGPTVCVCAAVHGDEINGTGTIRNIVREQPFEIEAGSLVLVPVVNILGFERHSRYMPDRRDLNRSFPGTQLGSLSSRIAHSFFTSVIAHCDYCIDLHTAALRRTNFPNVRADLSDPEIREFARAFGSVLMISGKGPRGSLRRAACAMGCKTFILEAGEVWKVEPGVVGYATRGIASCLRYLGMIEGTPYKPAYRYETDSTKWLRATYGGFLEFHIAPGEIIHEGDAIATNTGLAGDEEHLIRAPRDAIVLGMTTMPSVAPGDPICHLTFPKKRSLTMIKEAMEQIGDDSMHHRLREDLARNLHVIDHEEAAVVTNDDDGSASGAGG
ncbi:MAG: succinylglutamate desuccinylase/aspartoacylase family protein [Phycisphaerales bacterium]